jgi:hypothetical protein
MGFSKNRREIANRGAGFPKFDEETAIATKESHTRIGIAMERRRVRDRDRGCKLMQQAMTECRFVRSMICFRK